MAIAASALSLPPIPPYRDYTNFGQQNRADLHTKIPSNETVPVLQLLRPCHQRALELQRSTVLQTTKMSTAVGEGRIFWNAVADLIQTSSFFPITLNVPDILSAMGQFITQLPIINRIYLYFTQESTPRKKKKKKRPLVPVPARPQAAQVHTHAGETGIPNRHPTVKNKRVKIRRNRH